MLFQLEARGQIILLGTPVEEVFNDLDHGKYISPCLCPEPLPFLNIPGRNIPLCDFSGLQHPL